MATLLVASVGGAPEPVAAAILAAKPARLIFVCSAESSRSLHTDAGRPGILDVAANHGQQVDEGRFDRIVLPNPQDLEGCVATLHREVTPLVERWMGASRGRVTIVDFTGGTKCMSVALGFMARMWPCELQYVGGTERTKDGLGVVVSGREQVVHSQNPWNSLGLELFDEVRALFDAGDCAAAAAVAVHARNQITSGPLKSAAAALAHLVGAYSEWDRFDHAAALRSFGSFAAQRHALGAVCSPSFVEAVGRNAAIGVQFLRTITMPAVASRELVIDLLANARRRIRQGRTDDAVARIYRAIEATAQWRVRVTFGADTSEIPLSRVPPELALAWANRAVEGYVQLGLQDAWRLLIHLGDPLGARFQSAHLAVDGCGRGGSLLTARNNSYLAHGFQPATPTTAEHLFAAALHAADISESELPNFPRLGVLPMDRTEY